MTAEPRWSPAEVETGRDVAAALLLLHRGQRAELGLLLAQVEREGRMAQILLHVLGEFLAVESLICSGSHAVLEGLLVSDVTTWAREAS